MSTLFDPTKEPQIVPQELWTRPGPIPEMRLNGLFQDHTPSIVARQASSTSSSPATRTSCGPNDKTGFCERSVSSQDTNTIPIILGVILPLTAAFVVFIILHRRHVKKLKQEDDEDKHKSLDFGLGDGVVRKKTKKNKEAPPEMSMAQTQSFVRRDRGLSMDMTMGSPYLLPPEVHHSRESLHSLSRNLNTNDDKYRATTYIPDDGSIRSPSSVRDDNASTFTGSSKPRFDNESGKTLLRNAQGNPRSSPPTRHNSGTSAHNTSAHNTSAQTQTISRKPPPPPKNDIYTPAPAKDVTKESVKSKNHVDEKKTEVSTDCGMYTEGRTGDLSRSGTDTVSEKINEPISNVNEITSQTPSSEIRPPPAAVVRDDDGSKQNPTVEATQTRNSQPPTRKSSRPPSAQVPKSKTASLAEPKGRRETPTSDHPATETSQHPATETSQHPATETSQHPATETSQHSQHGNSTLPSRNHSEYYEDDLYQEYQHYDQQYYDNQHYDQQYDYNNQEPYHNYADDYYDEEYVDQYTGEDDFTQGLGYDPRRLTMGVRPLPPDDPTDNPEQRANRIRSFYKEYFDDKTKPANPRVSYYEDSEYHGDQPAYGYDYSYDQRQYYPNRAPSADVYGRQRGATFSNSSYREAPRAYSSASGRYGNPSNRQYGRYMPPRKNIPPPMPLSILPTPSKLKDDMILPMDFAPPNLARNQKAGTPDSVRGGVRPYSPTVRAHTPLASAFDDLAMMPSPHQLRKSSTFTALDFAPPPRFRGVDNGSDGGSVRSGRSATSAKQIHNIRNGAYRLSRVPREVAGTRDELSTSLKPKWDMNR